MYLLPHLDYHLLDSSSDQADESVSENEVEGDKEDKGPPKKRRRRSERSPRKKKTPTKEKKTPIKKEKKAAKPKRRGLEPNNDIVVVEKDPLFEERYSVINFTLHQIIFSSCIEQCKHGRAMGKWGPDLF